ncbi:ABC transporter substrate-binding protein [Anaerotalea alkaliphila]|nr:extracellular solute-binding protein [Anaerotalea alkaliphila]
MKKLAKILVMILVMASLSACGSKTEDTGQNAAQGGGAEGNGEKVQLVVTWWGNQARNERTQAALDLYAEENPNVTFDGQFSEWADYWNKLAIASAGSSLPDVIQMDYAYLGQYVQNDLLVDLKPYIESGLLDLSNVSEEIVEVGTIDGGVYGISIGVNAPALMYNKTLLDEAGIEVKDNMTIDEFIALSKEVYGKTGYKTNIAYQKGNNFSEYLLRGNGVNFFEGEQLGSTDPADYKAYFDLYEMGIKEGWYVSPTIFTERNAGSVEQDPLVYGSSPDSRSWCGFFFSNQLTAMQTAADADGIEIGITSWPAKDVKAANYVKPSMFLSVGVNSKNPEEAVKVIDYWTNSVDANNILLGERGVPISTEVAEAILPQLSKTQQDVTKYINEVVMPNSSQINPPAPSKSAEVYQLLSQLEEQVCYGKMTAEEAANQFVEKANVLLQ